MMRMRRPLRTQCAKTEPVGAIHESPAFRPTFVRISNPIVGAAALGGPMWNLPPHAIRRRRGGACAPPLPRCETRRPTGGRPTMGAMRICRRMNHFPNLFCAGDRRSPLQRTWDDAHAPTPANAVRQNRTRRGDSRIARIPPDLRPHFEPNRRGRRPRRPDVESASARNQTP